MDAPTDGIEAGEAVTHGEVAPYAKKKCPSCLGKGEIHVRATVQEGNKKLPYRADGAPGVPGLVARPCGCALTRFLKANKALVCLRVQDRALCWEAGKKPGVIKTGVGAPP